MCVERQMVHLVGHSTRKMHDALAEHKISLHFKGKF